MWMFAASLFSILVITNAAAQSCPANQIASDAQIILYGQSVVPVNATFRLSANPFDTNLTFFSEVLGYEAIPTYRVYQLYDTELAHHYIQ